MSLVPIIYDLARELDNYSNRTMFDDFGFGLYPHEIFETPRYHRSLVNPRLLQYPLERLSQLQAALREDRDHLTVGKDGFQVSVDVKQFKPNELTVKTTDNYVMVEGKHEEREDDHGFVQRHFVRKYMLPKGYNPDEVVSTISTDGVLTIKAPPPQKSLEGKERVVAIKETGSEHKSIKDKTENTKSENASNTKSKQ